MLDLATVTSFLGWCAAINIAVLICAAFLVMVFNSQIKVIHSRLMATHTTGLTLNYALINLSPKLNQAST